MRKLIFALSCTLLIITSCNTTIDPAKLYGKWRYIRVENPYTNPPDSLPSYELAAQNPYIVFSPDSNLSIVWGSKTLSSGKFRTDGNMIRYKENLPGGKTREFPFLVSKLDAMNLIFETMSKEGTRVTAIKE